MAFLSPGKLTSMEDAKRHRGWILAVLTVVYVFNYIDRQILAILQEDIKRDLKLDDTQLGMLTGLAFAAVFSTFGVPVARIADRSSRTGVVAVSLAVWSGFTAVCGLAGNFWQLLLARLGVGIGEAGGSPPAHAIISDLYEPEKRGQALAIYTVGLYVGTLLGFWLGGVLAEAFDWRTAFFFVGLPGVVFAIVTWATVREPVRGLSGATPATDVRFIDALRALWATTAFRYYALAASAGLFVTYGLGNFMPSFLIRTYARTWSMPDLQMALGLCRGEIVKGVNDCVAMSSADIGFTYGTVVGVAGAIGTLAGGYLVSGMGSRDRRWFLWLPMWAKLLSGPLFLAAMLAPSPELSLLFYFPAIGLAAVYLAPALAITHNLVPPGMRAMASAVFLLIINMIGLGLGPTLLGAISDWLAPTTGAQSLKWGCVIVVSAMYPFTLLWHSGAQRLPRYSSIAA